MSTPEFVTKLWFSVGGFIMGVGVSGLAMWLKSRRRPDRDVIRLAFGLVMVVAAVTATLSLVASSQCQVETNKEFRRISELDRQAGDERAEAGKTLILDALSGHSQPGTPAREAALREYVAKLDAAKAKRDSADAQRFETSRRIPECKVTPW